MSLAEHSAPALTVPAPRRVANITMSDGAVIVLRQYGHPGRLRIALSHGNGLAINAYAPFWAPLADDFELVVFDIRNHGENPLHDPAQHTWARIARDMGEICAGIQTQFGAAPTAVAFHSLSAVATVMHELAHGPAFAALALFDPPLFPPEGHPLQPLQYEDMREVSRRARLRSTRITSPEHFATLLARRSPFGRWVPGAHLLFARATLRSDGHGHWTLRNPRELEAFIYETNVDPTIYPQLPKLRQPLILIGADPACPDSVPAAAICQAAHDELGIDYRMMPGTTHFLQLEQPQRCREVLTDFLRRHRLY